MRHLRQPIDLVLSNFEYLLSISAGKGNEKIKTNIQNSTRPKQNELPKTIIFKPREEPRRRKKSSQFLSNVGIKYGLKLI